MKTIKVIDLLNKISKGEEVPKKIKYNDKIWNYKDGIMEYISEDTYFGLSNFEFDELNEKVEIIEEDKEIDKIEIFEDKDNCKYVYNKLYEKVYFSQQEILLSNKINELIDYLKSKEKGE